ncbi:fimbria/pilus outer membrane usher protein [Serratia quinivorans]|uniref:fimbria/pilus outer membrane usher protein n=1 Tax=Serratia quinivorans TaxID=137545 RepID=UPI0039647E10
MYRSRKALTGRFPNSNMQVYDSSRRALRCYSGQLTATVAGGSDSHGPGYQQQDGALSGSMIASSQGVTLGQSLGETIALVSVPGSPVVAQYLRAAGGLDLTGGRG